MSDADREQVLNVLRNDGWGNIITGLLTQRDKRTGARAVTECANDLLGLELWRSDDLARTIVETYPCEAFRRGYEIKTEDKDQAEEIAGVAEEIGLDHAILHARCLARATGGAAIFPVLDGAPGELSEQLIDGTWTKVRALHVLESRELIAQDWDGDIMSPTFGQPTMYRLQPIITGGMAGTTPQGILIHRSRLMIFRGERVTRRQQPGQLNGWDDSVLTRVYTVLRDFGLSWGAAAGLLQDFAQTVYKISGLSDLVDQGDDKKAQARLTQIDLLRSTLRAIVLDATDDFSRQQTPMSGYADVLDRLAARLAAAGRMPVTKLLGISPAGMNATGESDRAFFYDQAAQEQHHLEPLVERGIQLIMLSADGPTEGKEPDVWSIEWRPLWAPDESELADTRLKVAQADEIYFNIGSASGDDIATSRWGGDTYSMEMQIDWKAREAAKKAQEKQDKLDAAQREALLENGVIPPKAGAPGDVVERDIKPAKAADGEANPEDQRAVRPSAA